MTVDRPPAPAVRGPLNTEIEAEGVRFGGHGILHFEGNHPPGGRRDDAQDAAHVVGVLIGAGQVADAAPETPTIIDREGDRRVNLRYFQLEALSAEPTREGLLVPSSLIVIGRIDAETERESALLRPPSQVERRCLEAVATGLERLATGRELGLVGHRVSSNQRLPPRQTDDTRGVVGQGRGIQRAR